MKTRRILNPLAVAAEGAARLPAEQRADIVRNNTAALDALRGKRATGEDVRRLSHALLMADALARIAPLAHKNRNTEIKAGIDALGAISTRFKTRYTYNTATQDELDDIFLSLAVHHIQINNASLRDMEEAYRIVEAARKTQHGRAA